MWPFAEFKIAIQLSKLFSIKENSLSDEDDINIILVNIFLFDAYGEYQPAFSQIGKNNPNLNYKVILT